ncbi:protein bax [Moellerella wisconsensis]|uniref:Protein bax n=2 Tax=Moellerella wisconsensis TaxID=158849 RepID=A0A9Q8Q024_9GAMM|nr:protein bax [Moellerella wisconsensis]KLN96355.1 protein bax [Moellerella wisconsensis]UNH23871.1 protein bax [Moellerella wisconsensis]UNH30444.1 protein bax [Moellerella wisconsensis]UNH38601.1 protein bax [Moellerella wisconsensis]UNH42122.1 protein bax [Moellerella wisconsensis]
MPSRTMGTNAVFAFLILLFFAGASYGSTSTSTRLTKEYSTKTTVAQTALPDLRQYPSGTPRKKAFLKVIVPVIEMVNREIMQDRNWLLSVRKNKKWSARELKRLAQVCQSYGLTCHSPKKINWNKLLSRVDIMPTHFVVTQAATESGWGTSKLAIQNNNLFGMRCGRGCKATPGKLKGYSAYGSVYESVSAYMKNMNTHNAYESLRTSRAKQRETLDSLDTEKLIRDLKGYSQLGSSYNRYLQEIYSSNEKLITQAQKIALNRI